MPEAKIDIETALKVFFDIKDKRRKYSLSYKQIKSMVKWFILQNLVKEK